MNLTQLVKNYIANGYKINDAEAKVCQDIILIKISKSPFYSNVTIKGGVVMHSISNDKRRATKDLDIDFIRYSLSNESIKEFISKLNFLDDGITIEIAKDIIELKQQDYHGKRVYVKLIDKFNNELYTKLDIGVHNKKRYLENFNTVKNNWLEIPIIEVVDSILKFIQELEPVTV